MEACDDLAFPQTSERLVNNLDAAHSFRRPMFLNHARAMLQEKQGQRRSRQGIQRLQHTL